MKRQKIAVLFGGRSVEHEVSVITGHQVMEALETAGFFVLPIYITKEGDWYAGEPLQDLNRYRTESLQLGSVEGVHRLSLSPDRSVRQLVPADRRLSDLFKRGSGLWPDVFFPAIHGPLGEDGTLQGLFELADVPYVGSGVLASAIGMDKVMSKNIFRAAGLPVLDCIVISRTDWNADAEAIKRHVQSSCGYPVVVKPVRLGSSIGVKRCDTPQELQDALEVALLIDDRALAERALTSLTEINCSVLGPPVRASVCEQPIGQDIILSFEDKYKHGTKKVGGTTVPGAPGTKGMAGSKRLIPAPISPDLTATIQRLASEAFQAIDASGVLRADFLFDRSTETVYLNEVNTAPGSFSYYLWEASGISFDQLVTTLVESALERHATRRATQFSFSTNLFRS